MRLKIILVVLFCSVALIHLGCDQATGILCGEPEGRQKVFLDSVNAAWEGKLIIMHVPCRSDYIQIQLNTIVSIDDLNSIETQYCQTVHWAELLVYDTNGNLIKGSTESM